MNAVRIDKPYRSRDDRPATPEESALAAAWHREACGLRALATRQCKFWPFHVASARRVISDLEGHGIRLATTLDLHPEEEK